MKGMMPAKSTIDGGKAFEYWSTQSRPSGLKVSAVIPCLNEEETLGICIKKAWRCLKKLGVDGEVVVGDNGSTDRSVEIAESLGARVVHQPTKGYGAALTAGIEAAEGDIIVMADADDSYDWSAMGPFVEKIEEGYDLVMGNRFKGGIRPGAMPLLHRYLGNPVLSTLARVFYRAPVGDFHCGMRAFTKEAYQKMKPRTTGMEFATEMVTNSAMNGLRITEIPTVLYPDKRNRAPHLRSFRDGWRHLRFIMTYAPNYLYIVPGAFLFALGVLLQFALIDGPIRLFGHYMGIHFLALGSLLSLVGFNVVNLGLLAKVIVAQQYPNLKQGIVKWLLNYFTLEAGLFTGTILVLAGVIIDVALLWRWLYVGGQMVDTVHLAFVATSAIVIGGNAIFNSFLLNMFIIEEKEEGTP
jgi:glycosyltransferase involved in cell wall biosynthesis